MGAPPGEAQEHHTRQHARDQSDRRVAGAGSGKADPSQAAWGDRTTEPVEETLPEDDGEAEEVHGDSRLPLGGDGRSRPQAHEAISPFLNEPPRRSACVESARARSAVAGQTDVPW